ncbi:MAG: RdgB/HAM1 family non-canonical purine NTP pyrophosphatase [Phycisphaerae bacterium]|nr:RdgB/HAM1 family non-canonical purine NTP pyrophosphatase [Phycisphaerae bacterium]
MTTIRPRILIATGNPGKFREIIAILAEAWPAAAPNWVSLADLPSPPPEPDEHGRTFAEIAREKAIYYSAATGLWTLADDSGLEVDALGGEPGVYSARYAGVNHLDDRRAADAANNARLIERLRGVPPERRTARFRCAAALADGPRILLEAEGLVEGRIIDEPRGSGGFGYDPHFWLDERGCTSAELPADEKNRISHRGRAFRALAADLRRLLATGGA